MWETVVKNNGLFSNLGMLFSDAVKRKILKDYLL